MCKAETGMTLPKGGRGWPVGGGGANGFTCAGGGLPSSEARALFLEGGAWSF